MTSHLLLYYCFLFLQTHISTLAVKKTVRNILLNKLMNIKDKSNNHFQLNKGKTNKVKYFETNNAEQSCCYKKALVLIRTFSVK